MKNLGYSLLFLVITIIILWLISIGVERWVENPTTQKIIAYGMIGYLLVVILGIGKKFGAVFSSLFRPNQKKPMAAVRSFVLAVEKGLYERAYSLLTDQAQQIEKQNFPKEDPLQKKMPDLQFNDLETFKRFWSEIKFPWKLYEPWKNNPKEISDTVALVEVTIRSEGTGVPSVDEYDFSAKFITVKRNGLWFVANGFFWPLKPE